MWEEYSKGKNRNLLLFVKRRLSTLRLLNHIIHEKTKILVLL